MHATQPLSQQRGPRQCRSTLTGSPPAARTRARTPTPSQASPCTHILNVRSASRRSDSSDPIKSCCPALVAGPTLAKQRLKGGLARLSRSAHVSWRLMKVDWHQQQFLGTGRPPPRAHGCGRRQTPRGRRKMAIWERGDADAAGPRELARLAAPRPQRPSGGFLATPWSPANRQGREETARSAQGDRGPAPPQPRRRRSLMPFVPPAHPCHRMIALKLIFANWLPNGGTGAAADPELGLPVVEPATGDGHAGGRQARASALAQAQSTASSMGMCGPRTGQARMTSVT
jgi:hypothetical protein